MTGYSYSFGDVFEDAWVVKINGSGVLQWQKRYNTTYEASAETWTGWERTYAVVQSADGGYAIAGGDLLP